MELFTINQFDQKAVGDTFQNHKQIILKALAGNVVDVLHVGATSVDGLLSKGDLDIQVRVREGYLEVAKNALRKLYKPAQEDNWSDTFASFGENNEGIPVGIQVTVVGSEDDGYFYKVRDLLLKDAKAKEDFNQLKRNYNGKPMDDYRDAKSQFIELLLSNKM